MIFSLLGFCFPWFPQFFNQITSSTMEDVDSIQFNEERHEEAEEETISDSFICCVCLDLLYKPIVLECGHVCCFWCVHHCMKPVSVSHCPICRNPYHHFPSICEMLHFLLLKMYPLAYMRREKQTLEEEKMANNFSPQLGGQEINRVGAKSLSDVPSTSCAIKEVESSLQLNVDGSAVIREKSLPASAYGRNFKSVSISDLLCPACKQFLFCPAVLNCGHVFCEACVVVPEDGVIICKVCEIPHPSECPNICLELNKFLEEQFPHEYAVRKENVEDMKSRFQHKNPSSCCDSKKSAKKGFRVCRNEEDLLPWWNEYGSKLHAAVGCDYCGVFPIVGDRYKCQDCVERVGFDLCGDCYNTTSKRPGRFNQQHTPEHRMELVKLPDFPPEIPPSVIFRLVGGHIVDSSGAPVLAVSALDDSSDGWIAVDSIQQNSDDNAAFSDDNHVTYTLDDILDSSVPVEFSDAVETVGDNVDSLGHHDRDMDHQGEDSPSTS